MSADMFADMFDSDHRFSNLDTLVSASPQIFIHFQRVEPNTVGGGFALDRTHEFASKGNAMQILGRDFRYALRQLRRSPGFAFTAVLTLALGMGVNTSIFTVCHGRIGAGTGGNWAL
jgi:hypothetical protein